MSSRRFEGQTLEFGTSGYTKNNVFVLYDRNSNSVWWPLTDGGFDAVAGKKRGKRIPFAAKPSPQTLASWTAAHPDSWVMIPPQSGARKQRGSEPDVQGRWSVRYDWMGQTRTAILQFDRHGPDQTLRGRWIDSTWECQLSDIIVHSDAISFGRGKTSDGTPSTFEFSGQRTKTSIEGKLQGLGQSLKLVAQRER